jgi:putative Holliday junction resolvase
MTTLGIDWGEAKLGLALASGSLAEPYKVIRYSDTRLLKETIREIVSREGVGTAVVGISEGKSEALAKKFGEEALKDLGIEVVYFDETLTTTEAKQLAIEAGIKRKKRRELEDAFAASVMLQSFLDSHV